MMRENKVKIKLGLFYQCLVRLKGCIQLNVSATLQK